MIQEMEQRKSMGEDCRMCPVPFEVLECLAPDVQLLFPIPSNVSKLCRDMYFYYRTGPPMAPSMIASADFAACRASSVRGFP